jgi:D-serine deaminase-like pyridoxal phosphate-dependent protein
MLDFAARAKNSGIPVQEISIGSTPTLSVDPNLEGITEIRPGNYVFYDYTQVALGSCTVADCALTVLASVISHQKGADWFVTDAGALSLSKDTGPDHLPNRSGLGFIFEDYRTRALESGLAFEQLSQEHGIVRASAPQRIDGRFRVGARVRVLEVHSCLTAASFDQYHVVRGDRIVGQWPISRAH